MFIFAALQMALFEVIGGFIGSLLGDRLRQADSAAIGPLVAFAALMGACVFLPDQERRHFRFFVEHNVPPRYVWLTRQLPWMATLLVATIFTCWRLLKHSDFEYLWSAVKSMIDRDQIGRHADPYGRFQYGVYYLPPLAVYLSCIAVSYSAGQWASMMIRSGIMAGFCGLLLSGVLCGWVLLMQLMGSSWLWTVGPDSAGAALGHLVASARLGAGEQNLEGSRSGGGGDFGSLGHHVHRLADLPCAANP